MRAFPGFGAVFFVLRLSASAGPWTSDELLREALRSNPDLQIAYARYEQEKAAGALAGRWDNPELEAGYESNTGSGDELAREIGVQLTQPLPLSGRRTAERERARAEEALRAAEVRERQAQVVGAVEQGLIRLRGLRAELVLRERMGELGARALALVEEQVGVVSPLDVHQAKLEQLERRRLLAEVRLELAQVEGEVLADVGLDAERLELVKDEQDGRVGEGALVGGQESSPAVEVARRELAVARAQRGLVRGQRWEDPGLQLRYRQDRARDVPEDAESEHFFGIGVELTLPLWRNNKAEVAVEDAAVVAAEARLRASERRASREVRQLGFAVEAHAEHSRALDEALQTAQRQLEQATEAYDQGQVDVFQLLRAQQQHFEVLLLHLQEEVEHRLAFSRYQIAAGVHPIFLERYLRVEEE